MKQKLTLLLLALFTTVGAWAETITWESKSGWKQASGGKAPLEWFGATTPGSTTTEFTLTEFQIMHEIPSGDMTRYIAIATDKSTTSLNESAVVAVSSNSINPSAVQLYTYNFDNTVTLTGGTTYYIVFLTSNTPTNGAYPVGAGRVALNHTDYGTYAPGCSYSGGSTWWPYYKATLTSSVSMINVTYNLYESDGTTYVSSETVSQEPSSAVSIPSSLRYDYYYNYTTEGTIGTENCTIKVTRTLKNANIVNPLTGLNNNKSYYIKTRENKRNELSTYTSGETTYLAAVVKSGLGISAKKFAIINYEGNNYLYSVDDAKFVTYAGVDTEAPLANTVTGTSDRIVFSLTTSPLYEIRFDGSTSKIFNASNSQAYPYGLVFNSWGASSSQWDDGCQYTIEEAADFHPTAALAALQEFFHPSGEVVFNDVIAQLETYTFGTEIGLYGLTGDFAGQEGQAAGIISNWKTQGYSADNLTAAQSMLASIVLNTPADGYYRLKNVSTGKYLRVISADQGGVVADVEAADAASTPGTIVKIETQNGYQYYNCQTREFRQCYYSSPITAPYGQHDKHAIYSTQQVAGQLAIAFAYGNGQVVGGTDYSVYVEGAYYAPNSDNVVVGSTSTAAAAQWIFEEAEDMTIPLNGPIDSYYYATFCVPFDVNFGTSAAAFTLRKDGTTLETTEVTGNTVPAGTPVLLVGEGNSATATIGSSYTNAPVSGTALTGNFFAIPFDGSTNYTLGSDGTKVGFYHWNGTTLNANRAYVAGNGSGVKGFALNFDDDATAIKDLTDLKDSNGLIFNLAGQRISKMQKGINIINGKKIVVK